MTRVMLELDDDVVEALEDQAARSGRPADELVSVAVRRYVASSVFDRLRERPGLGEEEGMQLALDEIRAVREERRGDH